MALSDFNETFTRLKMVNRQNTTEKQLAGFSTSYVENGTFLAGCYTNNANNINAAGSYQSAVTYTIVLPLSVNLCVNDVIKRNSSGLLLKITSNPDDNKTPAISGIKYKICTAEAWRI